MNLQNGFEIKAGHARVSRGTEVGTGPSSQGVPNDGARQGD